jgi:L-lactate dehydrogenase complex protein LldE
MQTSRPARVQLFVTCLVDTFSPATGMAVVDVLERLGIEVEFPDGQTCCGQPEFNGGFFEAAATLARRTLDLLSRSSAPIVVPSGSCADMIVHQYPRLFEDDPVYGPRAREIASRCHEFSQFLVDVLGVHDVGGRAGGSFAYHASCHGLRGLGVRTQPESLLDHVEGATRVPLPEADVCCGFGGLFSVKMPAVSSSMLDRKIEQIEASGTAAVVVTDVSCGVHIAGGLRRRGSPVRVVHLADVLAKDRT